MKFSSIALTSLLTAVSASPIFRRDVNDTAVESNNTVTSPGFIQEFLFDGPDFTGIQVSIGSDNQTLLLRLDTKTSDLWVNSDINEYCLAYVPVPSFFNISSSENITAVSDFNSKLQSDVDESFNKFQIEQASKLESFVAPSASISPEEIKSYASVRQEQFSSLLAVEKLSISSENALFTKTASLDAIPSAIQNFGQGFTSKGGRLATKVASDGEQFATKVTSIGESIFTVATKAGAEFASKATSEGGEFATRVTSEGGEFATRITSWGEGVATDATSAFGDVTSEAVNGWGKLTSGFANIFGLQKRAEPTASTVHRKASSSYVASSTTVQDFIPKSTVIPSSNVTISNNTVSVENLIYQIDHDCSLYGVFNDSSSKSFESSGDFWYTEFEGEYVFGSLGNDTISLSGVSVNATIGVADASESNIGVLGIGKSSNHSSFQSFPYLLVENGAISKPVYSLIIGSLESSITFGAIDFASLEGDIVLFPFINSTEEIAITLSGLNISSPSNESIIALGKAPAIIDIANSNSLLPELVVSSFVSELNTTFEVSYSKNFGRYIISDSNEDIYNTSVSWGFQGESFEVPLTNFVTPLFEEETVYINKSSPLSGPNTNSSFYYDISSNSTTSKYILDILPSDDESAVLGLNFFKDTLALIVDLEAEKVGLAYSADNEEEEGLLIIIDDQIPNSANASQYGDFYGSDNITTLFAF